MGCAGGGQTTSQAGLEANLGVRESAEGLCTGPREVPHGFLFHLRAIDHRESARASEVSPWPSVPAGCVAPIPRLVGDEGGRYHPAGVVFVPAIPLELGALGASCIDKDAVGGFRWQLTAEVSESTRVCSKGAEGGDRGARSLSDYATAIVSLGTSMPMQRVLDCAMVDL